MSSNKLEDKGISACYPPQSWLRSAQNKLKKGSNAKGETSEYVYNAMGVRIQNIQTRGNANMGYMNALLNNGSRFMKDYMAALSDNRAIWQPTWETEVGTTVQNATGKVTKNYVVDYLSVANRDIMVESEGQYTQRYVYDENSRRISAEFDYGEGTRRGEPGENIASDRAAELGKVWYRTSLLGSTLFAVDADGEVVTHAIYDPWGNPLTDTKTDLNFSGIDNLNNFTGYTWDETLGLYFAQARFYDAEEHRFTQEDPVKDGGNWYVYCLNNPTNSTDDYGLATHTRYVAGNNIYMRSGAGQSYDVLFTLKNNTAITYLGEKRNSNGYNWAKVQYSGETGWIADKYLKLSKAPSISATVDSVAQKFGFEYTTNGDYFYASEDGWQRTYGYMDEFDKYMNNVPGIDIDFLSCVFSYNNTTWRLECWKGEYGPTAGGEIGLYVLDSTMTLSRYFQKMDCAGAIGTGTEAFDKLFSMLKDTESLEKSVTWYRAATSSEYIGMSAAFYKVAQKFWGGDRETESSPFVSRSSSGHWWLTAFKLYNVNKENIIMDVNLTFPDNTMRDSYQNALEKKRAKESYNIDKMSPSPNKIAFSWR